MVQRVFREHVRAATALLSLVSLGLVFAAAGRQIPPGLLPGAPESFVAAIPHVNAAISVAAIATIALGWRAVRRGRIDRHRILMLASAGLFAAFLALYLYRVALRGPHAFPGPDPVYRYVYLPVLAIHVFLAVVCVPLLYYVGLLAWTRTIPELRESPHPRVGRWAAALWLVTFSLGVVVYLLLYVAY